MPGTVLDWCELTGRQLLIDEKLVLFKVDIAFRKACYEEQERQREMAKERAQNK